MPIMSCSKDGKPGYKYGSTGSCYTYTKGDATGADKARKRAAAQGKAIEASKAAVKKKGY